MGLPDVEELVGRLGEPSRFLLDAVPVGVVVQDAEGVAVEANRAAEELLGLTIDEMRDAVVRPSLWRAVRRDESVLSRADHPSMQAIRTGKPVTGFEMGVDGAGGRRWLRVDAVPFADADGTVTAVVSSFVDITDRVVGEERLRLALDASSMGTWDWDTATNEIFWSDNTERLYGLEPGTFGGTFDDFLARVHPDDREFVVDAIMRAVARGDAYDIDFRIVWPNGDVRWLTGTGRVVRDRAGGALHMMGVTQDITVRKKAELDREASQRRLAFLAQATSVLAQSLDYETTLTRLAHLAVPFLADWCGVDVVEDDQSIRRVAVAYADPDQAELARRLSSPPDPRWSSGVPKVIRTGEPEIVAVLDDDVLADLANDDVRFGLYKDIGLHSLIAMPLTARGRTLGAIWFAMAETPHRYDAVDVDLAQELARRAALAVDNARLYKDRTHVARTLQASLLPPSLPNIPGVEVAARYQAAGEGNDIGGDFYDLYETGQGTWHVVIGDVCGKGTEAAAVTGLARHTLRAAAMRESSPSAILTLLNEAILRAEIDERFCTAAYACLSPTPGRLDLTLSCGGHPLPLVLRGDGRVEAAGTPGMLIGSLPSPHLSDAGVTLASGESVVFCTDGVTEASGRAGFFGGERLRALLATCRGLDAEAIAERIDRTVFEFQGGHPRDDIAIVVLRVL